MLITDVETSGLSPYKHGLCSIGAVHFETGEEFYAECRVSDDRVIDQFALNVNGFTIEQLKDLNKKTDIEIYQDFIKWAADFGGFKNGNVLGGHNVGHFDILWLEEINARVEPKIKFPFSYRQVDLHTLGFARFGESLSHEQICIRLGLKPEQKPHNALCGARSERDAIKLLLS